MNSDIDIYRSYIEDENISLCFYFTYPPSSEEVVDRAKEIFNYDIYVFDIFPEINNEVKILKEPLSVITKSNIEMFLEKDMKITFFSTFRILIGKVNEK
tara:strand:+ start:5505 stop:5801 length:297 start_codon:yes stop_codon:yes gene_type:complete